MDEVPQKLSKLAGPERDFVVFSRGTSNSILVQNILVAISWLIFIIYILLYEPGKQIANMESISIKILTITFLFICSLASIYELYRSIPMLIRRRVCIIGTPQTVHMQSRNEIISLKWKDIISVGSDGNNQKGSIILKYINKDPIRNFVMHDKIRGLIMFEIQGAKEIEEICKKRIQEQKISK